jgi:wobble nucleotide-excising tRNase
VICPFRQERTITKEFVKNISSYFDKAYESDSEKIKGFLRSYEMLYSAEKKYEISLFILERNPVLGTCIMP